MQSPGTLQPQTLQRFGTAQAPGALTCKKVTLSYRRLALTSRVNPCLRMGCTPLRFPWFGPRDRPRTRPPRRVS